YQATVVLIESRASLRTPLPVRARRIYVVPFKQPVIRQVQSQENGAAPIVATQPILAGFNLVLTGVQLKGEDTRVNIAGVELPVADDEVTDTQVIAPIPPATQAGLQS